MSSLPFRFVHASDFHLERPLGGLAEVPEHLQDLFIESAYGAAQRVFDTVLAEEAELLVLSGDVLSVRHAGLRGPLFLVEQFGRLAERDIPVYWAGGRADPPGSWPTAITLPDNVHVFPRGHVGEFVHQRDAAPLVRLIGIGRDGRRAVRPSDFDPDPGGLFSIAVVHGAAEPAALQSRGINYWALGGRHDRSTLFSSLHLAHYCGSPQGRCPQEQGTHGCTLVEVDDRRQPRTILVPTDAVRWLGERVAVGEDTTRDQLEALIRERIHNLIESTPGMDLLISWTLYGSGPLLAQLRRGGLATEILGGLCSQYGFGPPAAWSVSLEVEPPASLPPEWYEQETIRGDFLRAIRQLQVNSQQPLELQSYLAEEHLAGTLGSIVQPGDRSARERVLREAALLGVDLLSGEDDQS
jgi:exonuclease SbcD